MSIKRQNLLRSADCPVAVTTKIDAIFQNNIMQCLLVFDHLNDVVFTKYNTNFVKHIQVFAIQQGLIDYKADVRYIGILITHD